MAKPIPSIPIFRGRAARWLDDFLKNGPKRTAEQVRRDREIAARIKPLKR